MPRVVLVSLIALLRAGSLLASEVDPPPELFAGVPQLERAALIAAVRERNPSLEAARQALAAAQARPAQVSGLDSLALSYSIAPRSVGSSRVGFGHAIELSQALPYPGKRLLRAATAVAQGDVARADLQALELELATRAALLFADDFLLHRAIEINGQHLALLEDFKSVATARYAAGLTAQQDPLQAETELAHLLHDAVRLRSELRDLEAALNALLHRPASARLPPPPRELPLPGAAPDEERLESEALASHPEVRATAAALLARQAELDLARLGRRPDFEAMSSYNSMWSDAEHRVMVGVGLSLPVWRAPVRAAIDEAEARLAQARSDLSAREDEVRRKLAQALNRWRESLHIVDLVRSRLLPAASDQVEAALAGFKAGTNDFLALVEAERGLRSAKLAEQEALADAHRRRIELDAAVGRLPEATPHDSEGGNS